MRTPPSFRFFALQSASEEMDLQGVWHVERFLLRVCGLVLAIDAVRTFDLVTRYRSDLVFDGFVYVDQRSSGAIFSVSK